MSGSGGTLGVLAPALLARMLNHAFGVQAMPQPPIGLFLALYTSMIGAGTEVSLGTGYARQGALFTPAAGVPLAMTNAADVQWPAAITSWGTVVGAGVWDQPVNGNFYGWNLIVGPDGETPIEITINFGNIFRCPAGSLVVGIT